MDTKWQKPTICLSVFYHFVRLALKRLNQNSNQTNIRPSERKCLLIASYLSYILNTHLLSLPSRKAESKATSTLLATKSDVTRLLDMNVNYMNL